MKLNRMEIYLKFDQPLKKNEINAIRELVRRRANREPMAYILENKGFYKHDFIVTKGVLCPRPDTETLIEAALELLPEEEELFIADIGCGSGCIGISLALERPSCKVYAVDIAEAAIACTKRNVEIFGLNQRVAVLRGELLDPIPSNRPIDILVSNPPYIPSRDIENLEPEVSQFEPKIALDGGIDGLDIYKKLVPLAKERVRKAVVLEVGINQANLVADLMRNSAFSAVNIHTDLNGIERVVCGII